jgi:hypothetical protein
MTNDHPACLIDLDIAGIAAGLIDASLPRSRWTHAAHFAAALWLLRHDPARAATIGDLIRRYNAASGGVNSDTEGYHETITRASLHMAGLALATHGPEAPLSAVLADLLAGPLGRSDWLMAHWRRETLFSVEARRGWVAPDLAGLPGWPE